MVRLNPSFWPSEGWVFTHSGIRFSAGDRAPLVEQVAAHYARYGIPGDADADIEAQICERNPHLCRESDPSVDKLPQQPRHVDETLTQRRLKWLTVAYNRFLSEKIPSFEQPSEVLRRSQICDACALKQPDPAGCPACVTASAAMRAQLVKAAQTAGTRVGTCGADGADIPVAVRVPGIPTTYTLPDNCWRKAVS